MRKFIILFSIILIIVALVTINYKEFKREKNSVIAYNLEFEKNLQKEILGLDLTTIINKVINNNEKNNVEIGQDKRYINNETNSINIDIWMTDTEETYTMEMLYNGGVENFVQYYGNIYFKCTKIEYHKETGKVSYLYFEQVSE